MGMESGAAPLSAPAPSGGGVAASIVSKASQPPSPPGANDAPAPAPAPPGEGGTGGGNGAPPPEPVDEGRNFAERFAALTRREQRLMDERREFSSQKSDYEGYAALKQKALEDPLAILAHFGITYKDLTEKVLDSGPKTLTPEEQIQALREEIAAEKKQKLDDEEAATQKFIKDETTKWQKNIAAHVSESGDQYEVIQAYGQSALDLVWEVTEQYYETNEELLSIPDACRMVEEHLSEQVRKLSGLKRFQSGSPPQATPTNVPATGMSQPQKAQTSSITNQQTLSSTPSASQGGWDDQATRAEALKLINQAFEKRRAAVN